MSNQKSPRWPTEDADLGNSIPVANRNNVQPSPQSGMHNVSGWEQTTAGSNVNTQSSFSDEIDSQPSFRWDTECSSPNIDTQSSATNRESQSSRFKIVSPPSTPEMNNQLSTPGIELTPSTPEIDTNTQQLSTASRFSNSPGPARSDEPSTSEVHTFISQHPWGISPDMGVQPSAPMIEEVPQYPENSQCPLIAPIMDEGSRQIPSIYPKLNNPQESDRTSPDLQPSAPVLNTDPTASGIASPQNTQPSAPGMDEPGSDNPFFLPTQTTSPDLSKSSLESLLEDVNIKPFTESQLFSLLAGQDVIARMEKEVQDFLKSQEGLEKKDLHFKLDEYLKVHRKTANCIKKIEILKARSAKLKEELWTVEEKIAQNSTQCVDKKVVVAVQNYQVAAFDSRKNIELGRDWKELQLDLTECHAEGMFKAGLLKLQIENTVLSVIRDRKGEDMRQALNVLFDFQRKFWVNEQFLSDTRYWIDQLVAVFLENAAASDHLFLFNHVIRCPGGICEWAVKYIQPKIPDCGEPGIVKDFNNPDLQNVLALLATLLSPVKKREEFLKEFRPQSKAAHTENDENFLIADLEGEEEVNPDEWADLRENDLVSLLGQLPIAQMFKFILKIEKRIGMDDLYDPTKSSEHSFFSLLAFASKFILLLKGGLVYFNVPKLRNFANRLGQLIQNTVECVSDHWQAFRIKRVNVINLSMLKKIQVEYDHFFLRAVKYIIETQRIGGWQYLASVPYSTISIGMLWRIFYVSHLEHVENDDDFGGNITDWSKEMESEDVQVNLNQKLFHATAKNRLFLLTAFGAMAISRNGLNEFSFINHATLDIFRAGYTQHFSDDMLAKSAKDILCDIALKHPFVISCILRQYQQDETFNAPCGFVNHLQTLCQLILSLPLHLWRPSECDLNMLISWLVKEDLSSPRSKAARFTISKMNWTRKGNVLHLPWSYHQQVAIAIVEASVKYSPDTVATTLLESSMRQVQNLTSSVISPDTNAFSLWAWETVSKLRLHVTDQSDDLCKMAVYGDPDAFKNVRDFEMHPELKYLVKGVAGRNPLAVFVTLQTTHKGHHLPDIHSSGLDLLLTLYESGRYDHLLECLLSITPLFFMNPAIFIESEKLKKLVYNIFTADGILKKASDLVSAKGHDLLVEVGYMIQKQFKSFSRYGLNDSLPVIAFWLKVLFVQDSWTSNSNVHYLLNLICEESFFHSNKREHVLTLLSKEIKVMSLKRYSGFYGFLSSKAVNAPVIQPQVSHPYLAFFALASEERREKELNIWENLVEELKCPDTPLDKGVSNVSSKLRIENIDSNSLMIYRWSKKLLDCPDNEQMQVVFAQKFFEYYLARPKPDTLSLGHQNEGISEKFFCGMFNSNFLWKIKGKMESIWEYYLENQSKCDLNPQRAVLFKAFSTWLEDSRVLSRDLYVPTLPLHLLPSKLGLLIKGNSEIFFEYLSEAEITSKQIEAVQKWDQLHFRLNLHETGANERSNLEKNPSEEIIKKLRDYGGAKAPPILTLKKQSLPSIPKAPQLTSNLIESILEQAVSSLEATALSRLKDKRSLYASSTRYVSVSNDLYQKKRKELTIRAPCLEKDVSKGKVQCCSGYASVRLAFDEDEKNEKIAMSLKESDENITVAIARLGSPLPIQFLRSVAVLEDLVNTVFKSFLREKLKKECRQMDCDALQQLGAFLFYELVDRLFKGDILSFIPLKLFIYGLLEDLGASVIANCPGECLKLFQKIVAYPSFHPCLMPAFTPNVAEPDDFLEMYDKINYIDMDAAYLAQVLMFKMSIKNCMERNFSFKQNDPDPVEIAEDRVKFGSKLINLIGKGLGKTGSVPCPWRQVLHGQHCLHLSAMMFLDFPNHYDEILIMLIDKAQQLTLDSEVWYVLLNGTTNFCCMGQKEEEVGIQRGEEDTWSKIFERIALNQNSFMLEHINTILDIFADSFYNERKSVLDLFSRYRSCHTEPLAIIFSMFSHLYIKATIEGKQEQTSFPEVIQEIWKKLCKLYGPWLFPMDPEDCQDSPRWMREPLPTEILHPWVWEHNSSATCMLSSLVSVVQFVSHLCDPQYKHLIYNEVFQMYAARFAKEGINENIFNVLHSSFLNLNWSQFKPTVKDVEAMARIASIYLPKSHAFLGSIFTKVSWKPILQDEANKKMFPHLLKIIVRLAYEPSIFKDPSDFERILSEVKNMPLWTISAEQYEFLVQWYIMSSDPKVIIDHKERRSLDSTIYQLLQLGAAFVHKMDGHFLQPSSPCFQIANKSMKHLIFVRCSKRHFTDCASKDRLFLATYQNELKSAISMLLETIELVIIHTVNPEVRVEASQPLIREFLDIANSNANSVLPDSFMSAMQNWFQSRTSKSPILIAIIKEMYKVLNKPEYLASLSEWAINAFFSDPDDKTDAALFGSEVHERNHLWYLIWRHIPHDINSKKNAAMVKFSEKKGLILNLYVDLKRRKEKCGSYKEETTLICSILEWMNSSIDISKEMEPKVCLLYAMFFHLCRRQLEDGHEKAVIKYLQDWVDVVKRRVLMRGKWFPYFNLQLTQPFRCLLWSLTLFIRGQILKDGRIYLKTHHDVSYMTDGDGHQDLERENEDEYQKCREELKTLQSQKTFLGISDTIDWVLRVNDDRSNDFRTVEHFIAYLIQGPLFTEAYLNLPSFNKSSNV